MTPEENARRMREAIEKTGWTPPQPQPAQPSWAALASNPALAVGLRFNLGDRPLERFARGMMKPLPDNAVPDFAKPMQSDWEAKPGTMRRAVGDWLSRPGEPGESWPLIGPAGPMVRQMGGAILNDPIEALSEFSGYAPASRAFDAGAQALDEEDPVAAAGQWARSLGEGGMAAATVAGNAYGLGSLGAKAYRGGPVAALPDADMAGLKGRLAKAQTAGPSQIQTLIDDAGARAAAAESKIKPVDWSQVDMPEPAAAAAPQAPRDWAINIEGRTAPGRLRPRPEPDAYTPLDMTPEEQAAIDLSRQYQGRTSMWDQPSLSPAGPRAPSALSPEQKAAMNAEIERLALQAEDAGKAGDTGAVAKAHEDIASIMARTGRPLETSPRLQAIQERIDAIDRELRTADGAWREEELLAEAEALMNERRALRGKAPRQGALGDSTTLGMSGGNLFDEGGPSIAESIAEWARGIGKKSLGAKPAGYDDWAPEWRAAYDKGLPMDQASRMARAREQGFNVDEPLYHGTGKDFNEFNPGGRANGTQRLTYLSDDPSIADIYANSANYGLRGGGNPAIYPVYAKAEKPLSVSDRGPDGSSGWVSDNLSASLGVDQPPPGKYASLYDEAKKQKYDQVQIKQMSDLGGPQTQYIPLDPANIRSTAAAFDPDNIGKPTILGANGGNLGAVPDAAARTKVLQDYNAGRLSLSEAMDRGGYKSRGALYKAAEKVEERGAVRERGHPEGVGATIDKDAVAAEARAIMDEFGYIPRDYVTQIAKRLQMNRNSVGRAIFNMKLAKDPRVKGLPEWNDEANLMATPIGKAGALAITAGGTYLPARLAADFAADQQEEGALPAWMANLPRDPVSARPGL